MKGCFSSLSQHQLTIDLKKKNQCAAYKLLATFKVLS